MHVEPHQTAKEQALLVGQDRRESRSADYSEVLRAREQVSVTDPDCRLLQLADAKLARLGVPVAPSSWVATPWAA